MIDIIIAYGTAIVSFLGAAASLLYAKRAKKAEVQASEITNADSLVVLVEKAYQKVDKARQSEMLLLSKQIEELNELNKQKTNENKQLISAIKRLETALKTISSCSYSVSCPVNRSLQNISNDNAK